MLNWENEFVAEFVAAEFYFAKHFWNKTKPCFLSIYDVFIELTKHII